MVGAYGFGPAFGCKLFSELSELCLAVEEPCLGEKQLVLRFLAAEPRLVEEEALRRIGGRGHELRKEGLRSERRAECAEVALPR